MAPASFLFLRKIPDFTKVLSLSVCPEISLEIFQWSEIVCVWVYLTQRHLHPTSRLLLLLNYNSSGWILCIDENDDLFRSPSVSFGTFFILSPWEHILSFRLEGRSIFFQIKKSFWIAFNSNNNHLNIPTQFKHHGCRCYWVVSEVKGKLQCSSGCTVTGPHFLSLLIRGQKLLGYKRLTFT